VLPLQSWLAAPRANVLDDERPPRDQGKRQRRSQDLSSPFAERAVKDYRRRHIVFIIP
jgi:hypothetical protein